MNIVFFKVSPLGDTVMFLPVVQALRRTYPDGRITGFVSPGTATLFRETVRAIELIEIERSALRRLWRHPGRFWQTWRRLRQAKPDAVDLSYDQTSVARILARFSGSRVRAAGDAAVVR